MVVWSACFFVCGLNTDSDINIVLGTALALTATLSRHVGLALPVAFALIYTIGRHKSLATALRALGPLAVCLVGIVTFRQVFVGIRPFAIDSLYLGKYAIECGQPRGLSLQLAADLYVQHNNISRTLPPTTSTVFAARCPSIDAI